MADTSKYMIEERLIISVWKRTNWRNVRRNQRKFLSSFQWSKFPVKPISKKPRPHNVRQLAVVLLKRISCNYSDGFCWTNEERNYLYLQNDHSERAIRRTWQCGKWWCTYQNVKRLTMPLTGRGKFNFAYFNPLILWVHLITLLRHLWHYIIA